MVAQILRRVKEFLVLRAEVRSNERQRGTDMAKENTAGPAALVLMATVARRYYLEGASKSDIATELGLSRFKVARLIDAARASGIVRIELDSRGAINLDLSVRLRAAYDLRHCVVIDCPDDDDDVLRDHLGRAAAELLSEIVESGDVLGLAWGRSLMAMRPFLGPLNHCDVVQLTGALSLPGEASSIELVRDVGRWSTGQAFFFYAPMILPDAATAQALRAQPEIAGALARFPDVTKAVVGVGAWEEGQSTVADAVSEPERRAMHEAGVRAEVSSVQIDAGGRPVKTALADRLIGIRAEDLRAMPEVIAIVYGSHKAAAVHAALRSDFVTSVVTHTALASALLERA
jgi:DNA-binding transcriptional regulator LsrR (DeoR family)